MKRQDGYERELPNAHLYHAIVPIVFTGVWFLDSFIFDFSIILNTYIPLLIRLPLFIIIMTIALILIYLSHNTLFKSHQPPDTLIVEGIFRYTRNPMYLGIFLLYIGCIMISISLIAVGLLPFIFLIYNKMANFEENILKEMFGEKFIDYEENVPKWVLI
jgi:protein-S-isoprenylcysteine O-methyltransferase Ste14